MNLHLTTRETKLTDTEFASIERNADGRILDDFDFVWIWSTPAQRETMHGDDMSRGVDTDEEIRYMLADFI